MPKPNRFKKPDEATLRRAKMFASGSFRQRVKNNIELFRTYRINVHGDFTMPRCFVELAKNLAEPFSVDDFRARRNRTGTETKVSFEEIRATPQKL